MASTSVYASIGELKLPAVVAPAVEAAAAPSPEADVNVDSSIPPPLPPPNQKTSSHSSTLVETKLKPSKFSCQTQLAVLALAIKYLYPASHSEENVCLSGAKKETSVLHLSNSSPSLNLDKDSALGVDQTDNADPVYATVNKVWWGDMK